MVEVFCRNTGRKFIVRGEIGLLQQYAESKLDMRVYFLFSTYLNL